MTGSGKSWGFHFFDLCACLRSRFLAVSDGHRQMKYGQLSNLQRPFFGFRVSFGESQGASGSEQTHLHSDAIIAHEGRPLWAPSPVSGRPPSLSLNPMQLVRALVRDASRRNVCRQQDRSLYERYVGCSQGWPGQAGWGNGYIIYLGSWSGFRGLLHCVQVQDSEDPFPAPAATES